MYNEAMFALSHLPCSDLLQSIHAFLEGKTWSTKYPLKKKYYTHADHIHSHQNKTIYIILLANNQSKLQGTNNNVIPLTLNDIYQFIAGMHLLILQQTLNMASLVTSMMTGIALSTNASGPCFSSPARIPSECI